MSTGELKGCYGQHDGQPDGHPDSPHPGALAGWRAVLGFVATVPLTYLGLLAVTFFTGRVIPVDPVLALVGDRVERVSGLLLVDAALAGEWEAFRNALSHLVLPAALLGYFSLACINRMTRSFMLHELAQEYIVTARAKGLSEARIVWRHALRNALLQLVSPSFAALHGWLLSDAPATLRQAAWARA